MNSEIEQRIVAMYFDNKDFEKHAKQTINTLGELKDNLNLEDSVKGFDELDKAGKKLNLNQARTTVRNMKDSLSGMEGALKKAFDIGTAPLHALDNFFGTFRSYVGKFLGFDLASKFVNSLESAIRQLTIAPVEAGWNMYQANVDSTKTIMSGTLKSYKEQMAKQNTDWTYNEEEHMEFVKGQLQELSDYAQKTVFSLSDMTSNVGKFTNNNIDLQTSVTAMEGIANMTAKAGQGAQQASMAMYNFSQALGVGKMTTIDWKSIENANLATTELKQLFIDTAEAGGKLTKEVTKMADGKEIEKFFITVDKNGKKLARNKWIEVSAENFRDSLSNGWLDKDTMLRVMQLYSNQVKDLDTLAAWGFDTSDADLVQYLFGIGEEAEKAATQVRTFSKMWDAMTEAVQSGWADSMQYIFGDMLEATEFWTTINDKISEVLDATSKNRNDMLREWRGMTFNADTSEWEKLEGAVDGREDLIQGIYGVIDAAKSLGSAFSAAWKDVFGSLTGAKLQEITKGFRDFIDRFKDWLGDMNDTNSRLSKIRKGLSGVFSVLRVGTSLIKAIFEIGVKIIKPFIDPLLNFFAKLGEGMNLTGAKNLGEMLGMLQDRFTGLWKKLGEIGLSGLLVKIGDIFKNLWRQISGSISNFLDGNGLSGVKEWFISFGDKIKSGYQELSAWWNGGDNAVANFFRGIYDAVAGLFATVDSEGNEIEMPIVTFFRGIYEKVVSVWESIFGEGGTLTTWWNGGDNALANFFAGVYESIAGLFATKDADNNEIEMPIVTFFKGIYDKIVSVWDSIFGDGGTLTKWWNGGNNAVANFFNGVYDSISNLFSTQDDEGNVIEMPIVTFFKGIYDKIVSVWDSIFGEGGTLTKWWNGGNNVLANFFVGVYESVANLFKTNDSEGNEIEMPIVTFFKGIYDKIVSVWDSIFGEEGTLTKWWNSGDNALANFFAGVYESVAGLFATQDAEGNEIEMPIVTFFKGIYEKIVSTWESIFGETGALTTWWNGGDNAVANFFRDVYNAVVGLFTAVDEGQAAGEAAKEVQDIEQPISFLERIIGVIGDFVSRIMAAINGVVIPPEISTFFVNLGDVLKGMFGFVSDILGHLSNMISGKGSLGEWGVTALVAIIAIIEQIVTTYNNKNLAHIQTESMASKFMALGVGMLAISAALALLTTIDQTKMWSAAGALAGLMAVMGFVVSTLTKKTDSRTALTKAINETPTERVITSLIGALKSVGMVSAAMALLPPIIKAFGEAKQMAPELSGMDILTTLAGITTMIAGVSLVMATIDKMSSGNGMSIAGTAKTAVAIIAGMGILVAGFGGIIGIVGGVSELLGGGNADEVIRVLNDGAAVLAAIGGAIGGFFAALFGGGTTEQKTASTVRVMDQLSEASKIFDTEKTSGITRMMTLIQNLSKQSSTIEPSRLDGFAEAMGKLGAGIFEYVRFLEQEDHMQALADLSDPTSDIYTRLMAFQDLGIKLSELFASWGDTGWSMDTAMARLEDLANPSSHESIQQLVKYLNQIMTGLGDLNKPETGIQFDGLVIVQKLYDAIQDGLIDPKLPKFDATPVVDAIVEALQLGDTAIATIVHEMVQNGLQLSGTEGSPFTIDADLLSQLASGLDGGGFNLDELTGGLEKAMYGEDGKGGLMGSWQGLATDMEGITFPDMGTKLSEAFAFKDPDTGEDVDIVANLKETLGTFQEELNSENAFEIKIVPTFDFSNLNPETIRQMLGDYPLSMQPGGFSLPEMMRVDLSGLPASLDMAGVKNRISEVTIAVNNSQKATVDAINAMSRQIGGLESAILRLKLYLDTGALVGGITPMIDRALGRRAYLASSTGVASDIGSQEVYYVP